MDLLKILPNVNQLSFDIVQKLPPEKQQLVSVHKKVLEQDDPLQYAIDNNHVESVKVLISPDAFFDWRLIKNEWIESAVHNDYYKIVEFLLVPTRKSLEIPEVDDFQLIINALKRNSIDIFNYLIDKGIRGERCFLTFLAICVSIDSEQLFDRVMELYSIESFPKVERLDDTDEPIDENKIKNEIDRLIEVCIWFQRPKMLSIILKEFKGKFHLLKSAILLSLETDNIDIIDCLEYGEYDISIVEGSCLPQCLTRCLSNLILKCQLHQFNPFVDDYITIIRNEFLPYWNMIKYFIKGAVRVSIPTQFIFTLSPRPENSVIWDYIYNSGYIFNYGNDVLFPDDNENMLNMFKDSYKSFLNMKDPIFDRRQNLSFHSLLSIEDSRRRCHFYGLKKITEIQDNPNHDPSSYSISRFFYYRSKPDKGRGSTNAKIPMKVLGIDIKKLNISQGRKGYKSIELHNFCQKLGLDKKGLKKSELVDIIKNYYNE